MGRHLGVARRREKNHQNQGKTACKCGLGYALIWLLTFLDILILTCLSLLRTLCDLRSTIITLSRVAKILIICAGGCQCHSP